MPTKPGLQGKLTPEEQHDFRFSVVRLVAEQVKGAIRKYERGAGPKPRLWDALTDGRAAKWDYEQPNLDKNRKAIIRAFLAIYTDLARKVDASEPA